MLLPPSGGPGLPGWRGTTQASASSPWALRPRLLLLCVSLMRTRLSALERPSGKVRTTSSQDPQLRLQTLSPNKGPVGRFWGLGHEIASRGSLSPQGPSMCSLTNKAHPLSRQVCFHVSKTLASHQCAVKMVQGTRNILSMPLCAIQKTITSLSFFPAEHFNFIFKIFIGLSLLYDVVLVSAVQQSESATRIHVSPLFWISFPFRSPQSTE